MAFKGIDKTPALTYISVRNREKYDSLGGFITQSVTPYYPRNSDEGLFQTKYGQIEIEVKTIKGNEYPKLYDFLMEDCGIKTLCISITNPRMIVKGEFMIYSMETMIDETKIVFIGNKENLSFNDFNLRSE